MTSTLVMRRKEWLADMQEDFYKVRFYKDASRVLGFLVIALTIITIWK